jgi:hypothetical protein
MDTEQQERFRKAVDRKSAEAEAASHQPRREPSPAAQEIDEATQRERTDTAHTQDEFSVRDKNSGKGHKTADKWNQ